MVTPTQNDSDNRPARTKLRAEDLTPRERAAYLTRYIEQSRGRPPYRIAPAAGKAAGKVMRPLTNKFGAGTAGLSANWADIVGPRYAKVSKPARLIGQRGGTILHIIARGVAATLLTADSQNILAAVNKFMAEHSKSDIAITRLKITQGEIGGASYMDRPELAKHAARSQSRKRPKRGLTPSEDAKLQSSLGDIKNDKLKAALEKLGRAVITSQPE